MIITLLILAWASIGIASVIYWWTDDMPLTIEDLFMVILAGSVFGLMAFILFALPLLIGLKWSAWSSERILIKPRDKTRDTKDTTRYQDYNDNHWPGEE